jgi:retron-type reverse transcriptase
MDWEKSNVIQNLRDHLRNKVDKGIQAWRRLPKLLGCSPPTAVRNLIACSPKSDLPAYLLLLKYEEKVSQSTLGNNLSVVLDLLSSYEDELLLIKTLVLTERRPPIGAFRSILSSNPEQLFLARFWSTLVDATSTDNLIDTFLKAAKGTGKSHVEACAITMQKLLLKNNWPQFIGPLQLEKIPGYARRAVLKEAKLLTPALLKLLSENPYFHKDAPAAILRREILRSALLDIQQKNLCGEAIAQLAEDTEQFTANTKKVGIALQKSKITVDSTLASTRLKKALEKLLHLPEALALLAVCLPRSKGHKVLINSSSSIARKGAALLPVSTISEILLETRTMIARANLMNLLNNNKIRYQVLLHFFSAEYLKQPITYKDLLEEWLKLSSKRDLVKTILRKTLPKKVSEAIYTNPKLWNLSKEILCSLMTLKNSKGTFLWKKCIKHRSINGRPIPTGLRHYIQNNPDLLDQALEITPHAFWEFVRSRYPLNKLLAIAFSYPRLAIDLEKRVPRKKLRGEIQWIRKNWKEKPTLAAAYEVAAAFSLPDAGFLVGLGKRLRPPFDPSLRGTLFDDLYRTYELPKKSGGIRTITIPSDSLKRLQRRLLKQGFDEIALHPAAMGFRKGLSILDNAEQHVGTKLVANVDIHQFFPSTRYNLILRSCRKLCSSTISPRAARLVAEICCYNGGLPTGAPTSPAIANIVLKAVDMAIATVTEKMSVNYTRYADDLTVSGDDNALSILPFIRDVLVQLGFQLDSKKTSIYRKGRRQIVTGLVVNEKPNLPRSVRRKLRAAIHRRISGEEPYWHGKPVKDSVLLGHIAFLYLTQPEEAEIHRQQLKNYLNK